MAELKEQIKLYRKIVIYGAGYIAHILNRELEKNKIYPLFCIVSSKNQDEDKMDNLSIFQFDDCLVNLKKKDLLILVAVTEKHEDEIKEVLLKNDINNFLLITNYIRNENWESEKKDVSKEECINRISEWYCNSHFLTFKDIELAKNDIKQAMKKGLYSEKIIFAISRPSPRVVKIASALINRGYDIELLFYGYINECESLRKMLVKNNHNYHDCNTIEELMYYIIISKARIVHFFTDVSYTFYAKLIIKYKDFFPKIVFDQYDIMNEMYYSANISIEKFEDEKYCLRYADGICCRGYEIEYLKTCAEYKLCNKDIIFFDYCRDDFSPIKKNKKDNDLSICYAGGVATEREWPQAPYACFLEFASMCENNKCHFHVYPSTWDEERFKDYIELDRHSYYFHFHKPVPYELLARELSQYDYGIHPIKKGYLKEKLPGYTTNKKSIYSVANHFYDYLDAGLPIIAASPVMFSKYFEKEGVLLRRTIEDLDFEELRQSCNKMKEKVLKVRKKLSIGEKIEDLITFYDSL